jgi:hypothetical protein
MAVDQDPENLREDLDSSMTAEGDTFVGMMIHYTMEM